MTIFNQEKLKKLYIPINNSHKGQNGKLLIIGGSHLFHGASLWALKVASRIVDMVFYSSVPENIQIVEKLKEEFRDGIIVPRDQIEAYIKEADCILIGPGMVRAELEKILNTKHQALNIKDIEKIENEGFQTYYLTKYLLTKYPQKRWVIDAGSLQMMDAEWLKNLNGNVIITPHHKEFKNLFNIEVEKNLEDIVYSKANEYNCVILLKGVYDTICDINSCCIIEGGNAGMTKGGTGDVLAGLVAALACKNDLFLAAEAGSFINKKAGEELYKKAGLFYNASDLADEIPKVMKELLL